MTVGWESKDLKIFESHSLLTEITYIRTLCRHFPVTTMICDEVITGLLCSKLAKSANIGVDSLLSENELCVSFIVLDNIIY